MLAKFQQRRHARPLKSGEHAAVERTIRGVAEVAHHHGALLKVILETCLLSVEEKLRASEIAIQAGTDFLKTSTGFSASGATAAAGGVGQGFSPETIDKLLKIIGNVIQQVDILQKNTDAPK